VWLVLLTDRGGDLRGDFAHEIEIEPTRSLRGSADADDADLRGFDGGGGIRRGVEAALTPGRLQQRLKFGLDDGRDARLEGIHLRLLHVGPDDVMPLLRETARRHRPDVTETEYADMMCGGWHLAIKHAPDDKQTSSQAATPLPKEEAVIEPLMQERQEKKRATSTRPKQRHSLLTVAVKTGSSQPRIHR
jgi:hypothetical protein